MKRNQYTEANRQVWDQAEPVHRRQTFEQLLEGFRQPGFSTLDQTARGVIDRIGVAGKSVAQLCCNNGRETLSLKNLGAERAVGFDISEKFIHQGKELAAAGGIEAELVATDVYSIPANYDGQFDLIYVSVGVIGWLPDLPAFFGVACRLLNPGGHMFVYEMHPLLDMFEGSDEGDPPTLYHSYFRTDPFLDDSGMDYYGMTVYESPTSYWFHHRMDEILRGCLDACLQIEDFREYGHDISSVFAHFEKLKVRPPLSYTLLARKN